MINEYTISTAAEELDGSSKTSDQNFEESFSKNMNSEDPNFSLDPDNEKNPSESNMNSKSKKKIQYKHILNNHDLRSIITGKRNRKPLERTAEGQKGPHLQNHSNSKRGLSDIHHKGNMMLRHNSKAQLKAKIKSDRKLNKIFGKPNNYEEEPESTIDTKEVFENYYQRLKKKVEFISHNIGDRIIPEKRRVIELPVQFQKNAEPDILAISSNKEHEDRPFIINRNILQKMRDFAKIDELDVMINNFPKAEPSLKGVQKMERIEDIQKKLGELPKKSAIKVDKKHLNKVDPYNANLAGVPFNFNEKHSHTYINCDLRYFNFDFLVSKIDYFDVILVDPPWRRTPDSSDPSDSTRNSDHDTMSNEEIMNLRIDKLSQKGFIFLWIVFDELNIAYEMLNKWGYEVVDQIIWVKLKDSNVHISNGNYFMRSFEMCLLGYKCPPGGYVEYNSKKSNNIIFAETRKKGQKPDELYEIIDLMMPGAKKIELFAKNHNLRDGWFSLGNQLGDEFGKWFNSIGCNKCNQTIPIGVKRYKARYQPNYDLCETCFQILELNKEDFFIMNNTVSEDVLHYYHSCSHCQAEPIWGTRFTCLDCENFDLCEACFDLNLQSEVRFHDIRHNIHALELPLQAYGLTSHSDKKCGICSQKPIVGNCFSCSHCSDLNLCQNCFFTQNPQDMKKFKNHKPFHNFNIQVDHVDQENKSYKCTGCESSPIQGTIYKCENCFNFYFCEKCYLKRDTYKVLTAHSHKFYHKFTPLSLD